MGRTIVLTEEQVNNVILEHLSHIIVEGIDVDYVKRTVSFNDKHEECVDTSIDNNPTCDTSTIRGVKIYSIFKRKDSPHSIGDGNPLLYALKGENKYRFYGPKHREKVLQRVKSILYKLNSEFSDGSITIVLPSTNELNSMFYNMVKDVLKPTLIHLGDVYRKLTKEELFERLIDDDCEFKQSYKGNAEAFNNDIKKLSKDFYDMKGEFIKLHFIKDLEMRKKIKDVLVIDYPDVNELIEQVNGKNILFIDDSITSGVSIRSAIKSLKQTCNPKSISVLTLFSKKYRD